MAVLRTPLPRDYQSLAGWLPDARACMRWAGPRVTFPFTAESLPALLQVPGGHSHVLADDAPGDAPTPQGAVGFAQHWVNTPGAVHLGRIIVAPALRGRGLGRRLCSEVIARAVQMTGASTVTLRVFRDNTAAWRTYCGLGFVAVEAESDPQVLFMRAQPAPAMVVAQ